MNFPMRLLTAKRDASLTATFAVETSPGRYMEVDRLQWDALKDRFTEFCHSLPGTEFGPSYLVLKAYTEGNGDLAKLLIALGALAGVWRVHPPLEHPELWGKSKLYPMIAASPPSMGSRVPKLSSGVLERNVVDCSCCARPTGPADSIFHDLVQSAEQPDLCAECDEAGCTPGGPCQLAAPRPKPIATVEPEEEDLDIESYLGNFEK